ncbi:MAG: AI-2E family transporter [Paracoccaceae bacterium]
MAHEEGHDGMTMGEQLRWWGVGVAAFIVLLWFLADAILPFVLGAALAYLTDPLADRLERAGLSRLLATVVITAGSLGVAALALVLIIPTLIDQVQSAIANAPTYIEWLRGFVITYLPSLSDDDSALRSALENLRARAEGWSVSVLKGLWSGGLAVVDFVALVVITPVVAFYLLYDWDRMIASIDDALPRQHRDTIHRLTGELDRVLAGFVRGQLSVCAILGAFYAVALSVIGLQFGLLIGAFAGLISFIPFVGSILGGLMSIGIAAVQFWGEPGMIAAVAVVFVAGQAVEGNVLTPKLVGGKVGLHPVWLLFALSAFGSLFGFVGLLVAVPAAAGIGVIGRFLVAQYKGGGLYRGSAEWRAREATDSGRPEERQE